MGLRAVGFTAALVGMGLSKRTGQFLSKFIPDHFSIVWPSPKAGAIILFERGGRGFIYQARPYWTGAGRESFWRNVRAAMRGQ